IGYNCLEHDPVSQMQVPVIGTPNSKGVAGGGIGAGHNAKIFLKRQSTILPSIGTPHWPNFQRSAQIALSLAATQVMLGETTFSPPIGALPYGNIRTNRTQAQCGLHEATDSQPNPGGHHRCRAAPAYRSNQKNLGIH